MLEGMQGKSEKPRKITRAPRIRVPNNERALFIVDTQKFVGVRSTSFPDRRFRHPFKGSLSLTERWPKMGLNTVFGKVTAQVEFLQTGAEGIPLAQAFRFLDMDDVSTRRFAAAVSKCECWFQRCERVRKNPSATWHLASEQVPGQHPPSFWGDQSRPTNESVASQPARKNQPRAVSVLSNRGRQRRGRS